MKAIFAVDSANGIGKNGSLPWPKNKEDFAWFRQHTLGQTVIMGRNTWDDPLFPKPLPNRTNIVVTSRPVDVPGVIVVSSIGDASIPQDAIVIGGAGLITSMLDRIDTIYLTRFAGNYNCDVILDLDRILLDFHLVEQRAGSEITFEIWKR